MEEIYYGKLEKNKVAYGVRRLSMEDIGEILRVQEAGASTLKDKNVLQTLSKEEFTYILNGNGLMIGAFVDAELVAFRALLVPPIDEEHLGLALGLDEQLDKIIYQEISIVHPEYRGNRLQQKLAALLMDELEKTDHSFEYVCCTVAPFNIASLKDKFNQSMFIGALITIYEGKSRYVFVKPLNKEVDVNWEAKKLVAMDDIKTQQKLLEDGWYGYGLVQENDSYWFQFGKSADLYI